MAISHVVAASGTAYSAATTWPVTLPSGLQGGDVILLKVAWDNSANSALNSTLTSAGYTQIGTTTSKSTLSEAWFWKFAAGSLGSASSDASATVSPGGATGAGRGNTMQYCWRGCDQTTPIHAFSFVAEGATLVTAHVCPSVTTTVANCQLIAGVSDKGAPSSTSFTTSTSGWAMSGSAIESANSQPSSCIADGPSTNSAGTLTSATINGTLSTTTAILSTIALAPAAGAFTGTAAFAATASVTAAGVSNAPATASITATAAVTAAGSVIAPTLVNVTQEAGQTTLELAAKVSNTSNVTFKVSTHSDMSSPAYTSGTLTPDSFGYVHPVATGLTAGTAYFWQLYDSGSGFGGINTSQTLYATGVAHSFKVAFGGCVTNNNTEARALTDLISWAPDFWMHLGDFHYHNPTATSTATHLGNFEDQWANSTAGKLAQACTNIPMFYNRSDHDAGPSDNGDSDLTDFPGSANSIAATQVFFPTGSLADSRSPKHGLYRTWVVGRVRFIQIDIRNTDRDPGANDQTAAKAMLGSTQLAWLKTQLSQSEPFKVIVSDVAWMGTISDQFPTVADGKDKWPSYPLERTDIINYIAANNCGHVEIWHSDSHLVGYATTVKNTWGNIPVLCAAPFANTGGGLFQTTFSAFYSASGAATAQYGRVTFTDDGTTITRKFDGYDAVNATVQNTDTVVVSAVAITATAAVTAAGVVTKTSGASLAATAATSAAGVNAVTGAAAGTASATVTAAGIAGFAKSATSTATVAVSASGTVTETSTATSVATATVTAAGVVKTSTGSTVTVSATVTAAGTVTAPGSGSSTVSITAAITASGSVTTSGVVIYQRVSGTLIPMQISRKISGSIVPQVMVLA